MTRLAEPRHRCRLCGRLRPRRLMQRDVYGDEWECRSGRDCDDYMLTIGGVSHDR